MGKFANQKAAAELERLQRKAQDRQEQRQQVKTPPRGFSDFYGWKIDAEIDRMQGQW
jgi:hypothetical protein